VSSAHGWFSVGAVGGELILVDHAYINEEYQHTAKSTKAIGWLVAALNDTKSPNQTADMHLCCCAMLSQQLAVQPTADMNLQDNSPPKAGVLAAPKAGVLLPPKLKPPLAAGWLVAAPNNVFSSQQVNSQVG
jgi:hypothetical protein